MINRKFLEYDSVDDEDPYFVHYMSDKEIENIKKYLMSQEIFDNFEELSKNNWELHKKLIEEGHNPNEIAKIIRNDEIEKLQEISSQNDFDYNQAIKQSLYERCSFVNKDNNLFFDEESVSLIDYAAFFSAVKCFKYLLMNDADVTNTGKYAVAGGNEEIIHLCEQNHSTFKDAYEAAIEFHRNKIFKYMYENKIGEINDLEELGIVCVTFHNYEIFTFLHEKGMDINEEIIKESARIGNIFLVKHFLSFLELPKDILVISSDNIEMVKYFLEQEGIDINAKDIYLFYLIFI